MKNFKLIAYQLHTQLAIEFKLNEQAGIKHSIIVGTAINDLYRKLDAAKVFGARVFDSRLPLNVRIENTTSGKAIDSAMLCKIKTSFTEKFKLNSSAGSRARFAKRIWVGYNLLRSKLLVVDIQDVIADKEQEHENVLAARALANDALASVN